MPVYYSQLFVRKDSNFDTVEDLQGCVFAYNDEMSLSGYHCMRFFLRGYHCRPQPTITLPFFSAMVRTGAHVNSVAAVVEGKADALALDCKVLEALVLTEQGKSMLGHLRPISLPATMRTCLRRWPTCNSHNLTTESVTCTVSKQGLLGPNPAQPIVASRRLSPKLIDQLKAAFLSIPGEYLRHLSVSKYASVEEEFYEQIDMLMSDCQGNSILVLNGD
jgi:ABC-type phosphate/phosphonate transport system substrate-binding protein